MNDAIRGEFVSHETLYDANKDKLTYRLDGEKGKIMEKTMLDVLKERLIDGLEIVKVKETNSRYTITFHFDGDEGRADLPKSCSPGAHNAVADNAIITAISSIYFNRGEFAKAKEWLDKIGTCLT